MMQCSKKHIPLVVMVLLSGIVLVVFLMKSDRTMRAGTEDFIPPELSLIDRITISRHGYLLMLEKHDEQWFVSGKGPARTDRVNFLLESIRRLELVGPVSNINRAALIDQMRAEGRKIELFHNHQRIRSFYVYFDSLQGTCMMKNPPGMPLIVRLKGYKTANLLEIFSVIPGNYLEKAILGYKPEDIIEIRMEYPDHPAGSFIIKRNENDIPELSGLQNRSTFVEADQQEIADYLSFFSKVAFEDTDQSMAEYVTGQQPFATLTIKTRNGTDTDLRAYRQPSVARDDFDRNRYIAVIRHGQDTVWLNYTDTDPIFRQIGDFQKK